MDENVKAEGWIDPAPQNPGGTNPPAMLVDDPVVEPEPVETHDDTPFQSVEKVALEVSQGRWGVGQSRRAALKRAGYDPNEVEKELIKIRNRQ